MLRNAERLRATVPPAPATAARHTVAWPGSPYPLGATRDLLGVNFAMFSAHATQVDLCLLDCAGSEREPRRGTLPEHTAQVWHGHPPDIRPTLHARDAAASRSPDGRTVALLRLIAASPEVADD
jgi:pullulanase/glycogen debranching enzyme